MPVCSRIREGLATIRTVEGKTAGKLCTFRSVLKVGGLENLGMHCNHCASKAEGEWQVHNPKLVQEHGDLHRRRAANISLGIGLKIEIGEGCFFK